MKFVAIRVDCGAQVGQTKASSQAPLDSAVLKSKNRWSDGPSAAAQGGNIAGNAYTPSNNFTVPQGSSEVKGSAPLFPLGPNATPEMIARRAAQEAARAPAQTIDSTLKTEYNADRGDFYDTTRDGVSDRETGLRAGLETSSISQVNGRDAGRDSRGAGIAVISNETRTTLDAVGSAQLNIRDTTATPADFSDALDKARASQRFGGLVDGHTADDLSSRGIRSFLSDDGMAGGAVEPDGNI